MRMLLVAGLSLTLSTAYAQCEKKVDDMTQKVSIVSRVEAISGIGTRGTTGKLPLKVYATYEDNKTTLYIRMSVPKEQVVPVGTLVFLEMGSDSLELMTAERAGPDRGETGIFGPREDKNYKQWFNIIKFTLTPEQIAKLKAHDITAISVDRRDYDVSRSHQSIIADILKCLDSKK